MLLIPQQELGVRRQDAVQRLQRLRHCPTDGRVRGRDRGRRHPGRRQGKLPRRARSITGTIFNGFELCGLLK